MLVEKYKLKPANFWNMDEKGFLIGMCQASRRIVSRKALKIGQTKGFSQDGSREFVTIIAAIAANGEKIAPFLIYAADSGNIQDTWVNNVNGAHQRAYFGVSPTGWTSDAHGLDWLEGFQAETIDRAQIGEEWRLLILDGHSSHVNLAFLKKAIDYKILVVCYPPHSTHRLQPLDVSVFRPLASYYSTAIDDYARTSFGFSRVTKQTFWSLFWPAWQKGVRKETILSGFKKTGIWPLDPAIVLDQLLPIKIEDSSSDEEPISTAKEAIKLVKRVKDSGIPLTQDLKDLFINFEQMSLRNELLRYENGNLRATLIDQLKRVKNPRPLIFGNPSTGLFVSPKKIAIALQERDNKETLQLEEKELKAEQRALKKAQKDAEQQIYRERVEFNKLERARKKNEKEHEKKLKQLARERQKASKNGPKSFKRTKSQSKITQKKIQEVFGDTIGGNTPIVLYTSTARSGRQIKPPMRL